jgi:hypothetical protein
VAVGKVHGAGYLPPSKTDQPRPPPPLEED